MTLLRKKTLCAALLLFVLSAFPSLSQAADTDADADADADAGNAKRPNILWIVSEDNSPFLGCYDYPDANTPNLDELAGQGILYRNAFSTAPVCAPCRCSIITGMFSPSLGTQHMRSTNFVPERKVPFFVKYLHDAGYFCTNNSKTDYNLSPYQKDAWDMMTGGDHHKRAKGQPFFAVYNIGTSHESSLHKPLDKSLTDAKVTIPPYHPDTPEIRANWAMYHQIMTKMDSQVGDILKKLEKDGLADDTIVFYYADHGGILTRSKRFLYDTGVHVPMIVRFGKNFQHLDDRKAGAESEELVNLIDLAPTVLSLAGLEIPEHLQGKAYLGTKKADPAEYVYTFRGRMDERYDFSRGVRDAKFNYIRNFNPHRIYGQHLDYLWKMATTNSWQQMYEAGKCNDAQSRFWKPKPAEELYDTQADPWEVNNLATDPKYVDVLKRMRAANREQMLKIHDSGFWPEGEMVAQARAAETSIYELVRDEEKYPLERIYEVADMATRGEPSNLPKLLELMNDPHPCIRYWAVTGCLILKEKAAPAADQLKKVAANDPSPDIRITAAETLVELGEAKVGLAVLTELLQDKNEYVALHAANSLECLGERAMPALPVLQKVAKSSKGYVERASSYTAEKLSK